MNKYFGMLARFGLAIGIVRLLERRRENRMQRLFRRLSRRSSFMTRAGGQVWLLTRRRARRRGFQLALLPVLSAVSLPSLSLGSMTWLPGRRASMMARRDGRIMSMVLMAPRSGLARVAGVTREHHRLSLLGAGALGVAGLAALGWQIRSRSSMPSMLGESQGAGYWQTGGYTSAATQTLEHPNTEPRYQSSMQSAMGTSSSPASATTRGVRQDWADLCHDFSQPNVSRPVNVEVQEAGGSTRALAHGVPLLGIDAGMDGIQIMLGDSMENRMEHDVPTPVGIQPVSGEDGKQIGLMINSGDGSTTILTLA